MIFVGLLNGNGKYNTDNGKYLIIPLKRLYMMNHINKNNASHLSELLFQEHTHTQCIFKVPWTMKLSSTKTLNLHMNIIVKCSTKWVEKNNFWNKIKCYVTLHTVLVMFSHVFPAVCKIQSVFTLGIQNVKVQKEFWKRFDPLPPPLFCFLVPARNVYDVI